MTRPRQSLFRRLRASARGEVPADEVLARLSASGGVYDDYFAADELRAELVRAGIGPDRASPAESGQLLCTWNAYALVSLAKAFVEAEGLDPAVGGTMPAVSAEQALVLLREVPVWSARARRAATEPGYDVAAEVRLPAPLPWVVVEPCPRSHLAAMREAGRTMLERSDAALAEVERLPPAAAAVVSQLRGLAVDARARIEYATNLAAAAASGPVHEGVESALRDAVTACWYLGQVLARPRLAGSGIPRVPPMPVQGFPPGPVPGRGPAFGGGGYPPAHGHHERHGGHHDD